MKKIQQPKVIKKRMQLIQIKNNYNREVIKNKKDKKMILISSEQKSKTKQKYQIIHQKQTIAL